MTRALLILVLAAMAPVRAEDVVTLWDAEYVTVRPGATVRLLIHATIAEGYVLIAHRAQAKNLAPLSVRISAPSHLEVGTPAYPTSQQAEIQSGKRQVPTYAGLLEIALPVTVSREAAAGDLILEGELRYQACDKHSCLSPRTAPLELVVEVRPAPE